MKRWVTGRRQSSKSLLFTLIFGIATVTTALHELSPHHHADNCPVCVVDEHALSADIIDDITEDQIVLFSDQHVFKTQDTALKVSTNLHARAPPALFS